MEERDIPIKGMHCASCAFNIENTLTKNKGIRNLKVNYATEKATFSHDTSAISLEELNKQMREIGYEFDLENDNDKLHILNIQKRNLYILLPIALLLFFLMIWEIVSKNFTFLPPLDIDMMILNPFLFLISTFTIFYLGRSFVQGLLRFLKEIGRAHV